MNPDSDHVNRFRYCSGTSEIYYFPFFVKMWENSLKICWKRLLQGIPLQVLYHGEFFYTGPILEGSTFWHIWFILPVESSAPFWMLPCAWRTALKKMTILKLCLIVNLKIIVGEFHLFKSKLPIKERLEFIYSSIT